MNPNDSDIPKPLTGLTEDPVDPVTQGTMVKSDDATGTIQEVIKSDVASVTNHSCGNDLNWDHFTSLTDQEAQDIVDTNHYMISLGGLQTLTDSAAKILGDSAFGVSLPGLSSISDNAAEYLGGSKTLHSLHLPGIRTMGDHQCGKFHNPVLELGLSTLSPQQARDFFHNANNGCIRELPNLLSVTDEIVAEFKSGGKIYWLSLPSLSALTPQQALPVMDYAVMTLGITSMTDDLARVLSCFSGEVLLLPHITSVTETQAKYLAHIYHYIGADHPQFREQLKEVAIKYSILPKKHSSREAWELEILNGKQS